MKMTLAKIKRSHNYITSSMHELKKKFFELEVMQSVWEAEHGKAKRYASANILITNITRGLR